MGAKIIIKRTLNADTRTMNGSSASKADIMDDTHEHISAVKLLSNLVCNKIHEQVAHHDYTKIGEYSDQFVDALNKGSESKEFKDWYEMHVTTERHHLKKHVPEDVNLIDVIEMLCDCVCAAKARTGKIYDVDIPTDVLVKAVKNTVTMLSNAVDVED